MTMRTRRPQRLGIRARLGGLVETEERQQATVTVLFIGTIITVALILLGAIGLAWYNDNLRAAGQGRLCRDRAAAPARQGHLEQWRISRDEGRHH